jgi:hypothetical protein
LVDYAFWVENNTIKGDVLAKLFTEKLLVGFNTGLYEAEEGFL